MLLSVGEAISVYLSKEIFLFLGKTMKLFTNITILFLSLRRGFEPLPDPRQSLARAQLKIAETDDLSGIWYGSQACVLKGSP